MYSTSFLIVSTLVFGGLCGYGLWYAHRHGRRPADTGTEGGTRAGRRDDRGVGRSATGVDNARANVFDVAQYIRDKVGPLSSIRLQKLVFYSKAWSLVWDDDPLFAERVEAWSTGPVVPVLYEAHRGEFFCPERFEGADVSRLTDAQKETVDAVLDAYGHLSPQGIVHLSLSEAPWVEAGGGTPEHADCHNVITDEAIAEYYSSLCS